MVDQASPAYHTSFTNWDCRLPMLLMSITVNYTTPREVRTCACTSPGLEATEWNVIGVFL